jgi:hypothetical protein
LIGPFLYALGAIPVRRRQDEPGGAASAGPARNRDMFDAAVAALREGGAILIFPEGTSQPEPALMPLRSGVARLVLQAETGAGPPVGVRLVPLGLIFHEPGTFRSGWAVVVVGAPVPLDDCILLHARAPAEAVRRLTERVAEALGGLIVEAGDRHTLRLVQVLESVWRMEAAGLASDPAAVARWRRQVTRAHRYLAAREPTRIAALRDAVERYADALAAAGLDDRAAAGRPGLAAAMRYAVREGAALLQGFPLALWGLVNHGLPYHLTAGAVRLARPDPDAEATYKIAGGLFIYLACWAAEGWAAWRIAGPWALGVFVASLGPTGFFALAWRERLARVARDARAVLRFLVDHDLPRLLGERRRAIMAEVDALLELVPAPVLDTERPTP